MKWYPTLQALAGKHVWVSGGGDGAQVLHILHWLCGLGHVLDRSRKTVTHRATLASG